MGNGKRQSARLAARQASKQSPQPLPSQPPTSPPLATIHDLPLEIIGRIITIAYSAEPANWEACQERYRFLKATSLVCREWTPFAQAALWLDVSLYGGQLQSFFEAGAGRHATHKLSVTYGSGKDDSVEAILRNVRGVRELKLFDCPVSMDWLCGDNLKDLKTLNLSCVTESASVSSHSLPFQLTELKISSKNNPRSFTLIDALSRQSSITSFLVITHGFDLAELLTRLAPLAPGLDTLDILLRDVPGAAEDFFKGCTHLKHLKTRLMPLNAVKHVAASLASWTVHSIDDTELSTLLNVLKSGSVATAKLETLVLNYCSARTSPRWVELVKMCKEKKIELVEVDY